MLNKNKGKGVKKRLHGKENVPKIQDAPVNASQKGDFTNEGRPFEMVILGRSLCWLVAVDVVAGVRAYWH